MKDTSYVLDLLVEKKRAEAKAIKVPKKEIDLKELNKEVKI